MAANQLMELVERFKEQRLSQAEIYVRFDQFRARLHELGRDAEEERVREVLDRIVGWCSPEEQLFPYFLLDADIEACRQKLAAGGADFAAPSLGSIKTATGMSAWLTATWGERAKLRSVQHWSAPPEDVPWLLQGERLEQVIAHLFQSLQKQLPRTSKMLQNRCKNLWIIRFVGGDWLLLFVVQAFDQAGQPCAKLLGGGQPSSAPRLRAEVLTRGWSLPAELRHLYSHFNGFGWVELPWHVAPFDCVLPDSDLYTLGEHLEAFEESDLRPDDILIFFPDGAGNGQCFYRPSVAHQVDSTYDWDHETQELSQPRQFWKFVDAKLSHAADEAAE